MTDLSDDVVEFDEVAALALAELTLGPAPRPIVKARIMARISETTVTPPGFSLRFNSEDAWLPHPVPGIRMKVLSVNRRSGYQTLLLDVKPGTRFPAHHHDGAEECYVISGSVFTLGRRLGPGDFVHADAGTDHAELWTDEGARVLLVVPADDDLPSPNSGTPAIPK
jgi:quercetin dioxygenase-like cupin family protein